jgi:hypothetical protein
MAMSPYGTFIGRPKGALNYVNRELREYWHQFFSSEEYRQRARERILSGEAPHLESYLLNRIYGKPKDHVELTVEQGPSLADVSTEELISRALGLIEHIRALPPRPETIDVEAITAEDGERQAADASRSEREELVQLLALQAESQLASQLASPGEATCEAAPDGTREA